MTFRTAAFVAAGLAFVCSSSIASATGYHPVVRVVTPVAKSSGGSGGGGGGNWYLCPTPAGIFICAVTVAIVWCADNQPKRNMRRDTWSDGRHDVNPIHNPRAEGCVVKGKAKPISTRG